MWNKATVKVDKKNYLAWVKDNEIQMKNIIEIKNKINLDGKSRTVDSHSIKENLLSIILKPLKK
jgi:hypothetical protein